MSSVYEKSYSVFFFVMQMSLLVCTNNPSSMHAHFEGTLDLNPCAKFHKCKSFLIEVMTSG